MNETNKIKGSKYILLIKILFINLGLFIMPTLASNKTNFNYLEVRQQIESICSKQGLSTEERPKQIYPLRPVTDEDMTELYFGPNFKDKWNLKNTPEGKQCSELINNTDSLVPVEMIIKKYQDVMDANPIDINKITNLEHNISEYGSFYGVNWYALIDYMDSDIALPILPGEQQPSDYNVARTDAFIKLLKQQSDDYVLHFMLLVQFDSSGDFILNTPDYRERMQNGTVITYASPQLIKTFPQWYKAWNKLVPTMCQRFQSWYMDAQNVNLIQKACGDLITAKKYRMTKEQQKKWEMQYEIDHRQQ